MMIIMIIKDIVHRFIKPMISVDIGYGDCNNQAFVLWASPNDLIDKLKYEIFERCRIAPSRQLLRWGHKRLESGTRLNQYPALTSHSTIDVLKDTSWFEKEFVNIENG